MTKWKQVQNLFSFDIFVWTQFESTSDKTYTYATIGCTNIFILFWTHAFKNIYIYNLLKLT